MNSIFTCVNILLVVQIPSLSTAAVFISTAGDPRLFEAVMGIQSQFHKGPLHPVETVSWWDAVIFL